MRVLRSVRWSWRPGVVLLAAGAVLVTSAGAPHASRAATTAAAPTTLTYTGPPAVDAEDAFQLRAQLKTGTRHLVDKTVTFTFNGVTTSVVTNTNGLAVVSMRAPAPGSYAVDVSFAGDEAYEPSATTAVLEVRKLVPVVNYTGMTSTAPGDELMLKASLKRGVKSVVGRTVTFTVEGASYSAVTNGAGHVQLLVTAPTSEGTFPIEVAFAGDEWYEPAAETATLTLARLVTTLTYTGVTTIPPKTKFPLYASLKAGSRAAVGRPVTFVLDGVSGTVLTNSNGLATFWTRAPVTPGTYEIAITFDGDVTNLPSSTTGTIVVG